MFPSSSSTAEAVLHDAKRRDPTMPDPSKARFGESVKFLPVCFVFSIIICLWVTYCFCHCAPLLTDPDTHEQGVSCLVVFNVLTGMVLLCYYRSMMQHPGTIPDSMQQGELQWEYTRPAQAQQSGATGTPEAAAKALQKEKKRLGERRNCKWCNKFKPDRCHHCRVCRMCILKMDHHCPWIYNCVGFKNFKYFFLLVVYATAASNTMLWTMLPTVVHVSHDPYSSFLKVFWILFGVSLAGLMVFLLTAFLFFHIHLMLKAMTTIEFCEKSRRPNFDTDIYSLGWLGNVQAVLGENPLLWLLPIHNVTGDGINFESTNSLVLSKEKFASDVHSAHQASLQAYGSTGNRSNQNSAGTGEQPDDSDRHRADEYGSLSFALK